MTALILCWIQPVNPSIKIAFFQKGALTMEILGSTTLDIVAIKCEILNREMIFNLSNSIVSLEKKIVLFLNRRTSLSRSNNPIVLLGVWYNPSIFLNNPPVMKVIVFDSARSIYQEIDVQIQLRENSDNLSSYIYSIQTPYLSLVDLPANFDRQKFHIQTLKIFKLFDEIANFQYFPVMTIFAEQEIIALIRHYLSTIQGGHYPLDHENGARERVDRGGGEDMLPPGFIIELFRKINLEFGCYTPPNFWNSIKNDPVEYQNVLRQRGVLSYIHLSDLPCVFIYPFLIENEWKRLLDRDPFLARKGIDTDTFLLELLTLVFVHEHAHALLRHGINRNQDPLLVEAAYDPNRQEINDAWRRQFPWVEEGLAMYFERAYILRWVFQRELRDVLLAVHENYVQESRDLEIWPYHGYEIIKDFVENKGSLPELITAWKFCEKGDQGFKRMIESSIAYYRDSGQIRNKIDQAFQ